MIKLTTIIYRANKVIALPNPKTGGTKHSMAIAKGLGIPCLDITDKTFEEIVEFLNN